MAIIDVRKFRVKLNNGTFLLFLLVMFTRIHCVWCVYTGAAGTASDFYR